MFKHILLPTDGSPLSETAMRKGIEFAKTIKTRVTGFCVIPALPYVGCGAEIGTEFKKQAEAAVQEEVNKNLIAIEKAGKEAGVQCETAKVKSVQPYEAIIEAAQKKEMRSHYHGFPRTAGRPWSAARQRDSKGADPFQNSSAGVSLDAGEARQVTCFQFLRVWTCGSI